MNPKFPQPRYTIPQMKEWFDSCKQTPEHFDMAGERASRIARARHEPDHRPELAHCDLVTKPLDRERVYGELNWDRESNVCVYLRDCTFHSPHCLRL